MNNRGFSIVEIITVAVILTILMAICVPLLMSYFDKSEDSIKEDARLILMSAQNKFMELYNIGSHSDKGDCIISGAENKDNESPTIYHIGNNKNKDCDIYKNPISASIFEAAGFDINMDEPYCLFVGAGRYDIYTDPLNDKYDPKKAYTIYTLTYLNTLNDDVIFWTYDKGFTKEKPYVDKEYRNGQWYFDNNATYINGEKIYIQYYFIKSGTKNNIKAADLWKEVKKHYNKEANPDL